jgi:hypothetical protein
MKKLIPIITLGMLTALTANTVLADSPAKNHFEIGIQGGTGIAVAGHKGTYTYTTGGGITTTNPFQDTAANLTGLLGLSIGYDWSISNSHTIGIKAEYNQFFGRNEQNWSVDDAAASTATGLNFKNQLKTRSQYNLLLTEAIKLNSNLNWLFSIGGSSINVRYSSTPSATSPTESVGSSSSQTKFLFGAVVGSNIQYAITRKTSFNVGMDLYMYAPRKFSTLTNVGQADSNDQLKDRKLSLFIPTVSAGYTYSF